MKRLVIFLSATIVLFSCKKEQIQLKSDQPLFQAKYDQQQKDYSRIYTAQFRVDNGLPYLEISGTDKTDSQHIDIITLRFKEIFPGSDLVGTYHINKEVIGTYTTMSENSGIDHPNKINFLEDGTVRITNQSNYTIEGNFDLVYREYDNSGNIIETHHLTDGRFSKLQMNW